MTKNTNILFIILQVIAWIIFVGLCIEAGAILVNFVYSLFKPSVVQYLYQKVDLRALYQRSQWAYYGMYSFIIAIALLKAHLFYIVIRLLLKLDLAKPFNSYVSEQITQLSYYTFSIGLISYIGRQTAKSLIHYGYDSSPLNPFWADSQAFILMAAVIYVIAAIFAKGVEIQNENDLTV